MTALMSAAADGHLDTVRLLLDKGAAINLKDNGSELRVFDLGPNDIVHISARTALDYAAGMNENVDVLRLLLDRGADVNERDGNGQTLLICVAGSGEIEKVRLLLAHKANVHLRNRWGETALVSAQNNHHGNIIRLLKKAGARE